MLRNAADRQGGELADAGSAGSSNVISSSRIPIEALLDKNDTDHPMAPLPEPMEPDLTSSHRQLIARADVVEDIGPPCVPLRGVDVPLDPSVASQRKQDRVEDQPMPTVPWPVKEYHRRPSSHTAAQDTAYLTSPSPHHHYHHPQFQQSHFPAWAPAQQNDVVQDRQASHTSTVADRRDGLKTLYPSDTLERMDSGREIFSQTTAINMQPIDGGEASFAISTRRMSAASGTFPPLETPRGTAVVSRQSSETEAFSTGWCWSDLTASDRSRSSLDIAMLLSPKNDLSSPSASGPISLPPVRFLQNAVHGIDPQPFAAEHHVPQQGQHHQHSQQRQQYQREYELQSQSFTHTPQSRNEYPFVQARGRPSSSVNDDNDDSDDDDEDESGMPTILNCKVEDRAPRRRWKEWEDSLLKTVVENEGPNRWNEIARHFPGRNGRQVRLRWMNHLQPSLDRAPWRPQEDEQLLAEHERLGNKWAQIAERLGGRTDNAVKNRFKSLQRRAQREQRNARHAHFARLR